METITCGSWIGQLGKALAPRELEALLWVAQGLTTKEIARQMAVSPGTVANRIENALFKLEAGRRIEAVTKAMRRNIISPMCFLLAALVATHAAIGDSDPMRRDRRVPERRIAQVRVLRKAESFVHHA
ncbi:response regulator transcription factor [Pseudomonas putida]|uniref:response regulator transcription factor n=1 Tax=Pseudomonas putida TaxID=303 RepID=UPI0008197362|nr:helix-turn-helix transcriptional regulator [Pseudomonas putida]OCT28180.1 helix-turn-helix transcriptional regulator [Pseudomonas putida]OCT30217.1 helix-turn-helix transcriptional regulator [Pseudomonas putida]OCT31073.1 helix-turn-helix transcriptional regulator [Pseudomonas putida]OCT41073.1 helix-turn-helix transcriptional regulator [Pseudomonas putida]